LFPECTLSIHVLWGLKMQNTVLAMGKSIIDRTSRLNVGELCLTYGGGGHHAAGTCQVENSWSEKTLAEILGLIELKAKVSATA
jgi:nanoRNase/pAp phosphatase (c-di-AMP/oligoRNAs hydrolase)